MLTHSLIRRVCGVTTYQRGMHYMQNGRVLSINEEAVPDGIRLRGICRGHYQSHYQQEVFIPHASDLFPFEGECTCPVGYNCKHVAAVLLQWLSEKQGNTVDAHRETATDRLMRRLAGAAASESQELELGTEQALYVISPHAQRAGIHYIQRFRARLLKNGKGYGKPRPLRYYEIHSSSYEALLRSPLDFEIRTLLEASENTNSVPTLSGELGALILRKLLATGRCHWQDIHTPPLRTGQPRTLAPNWQREKSQLRLQLDTAPTGGLVLPVTPPAYLDPTTHTIGPLLGADAFAPEQLSVLAGMPVIPVAEAKPLAERLLLDLPDLPLPPPVELTVHDVQGKQPRPLLRLRAADASAPQPAQLAELSFAYGPERVAPPTLATTTLRRNDTLVRIHRDPEQEAQLITHLQDDYRFAAAGAPNHFAPATDDFREALHLWRAFLEEGVTQLREEGWTIDFDPSFRLAFSAAPTLDIDIEETSNDWFDLALRIEVNGQQIELLPLLQPLLQRIDSPTELDSLDSGLFVEIENAHWMEIPAADLRPVIEILFELFDTDSESLRLGRFDAARLADIDSELAPVWRGGEALRALGQRLRTLDALPQVAPPAGLSGELRPYQAHGLAWLQFLRETGFGGILADDMGLGKTLQTLAHLLLEKEQGRLQQPALIVAPTSLMSNWRREAQRFTPTLSVLTLQGPERHAHFAELGDHDLVLTTYPLLPRDHETLTAQSYHCVILDEAQTIKNPRSQTARIARQLRADQRICLSGTPMENHLGELWSLFHFLAPGFLGDPRHFAARYRTPIERDGDTDRQLALQRRVAPFLLRRTKEQVASELPKKIETTRSVALHEAQAELYESVRLAMDKKVRDALKSKGLARSHIIALDALLKLRQICCDPRLVKLDSARQVHQSAKLDLLMEILPELLDEGRRILLFSQFTEMLTLIEEQLTRREIAYTKLTGRTRKRDEAIERFRSGAVPLFLISLKAGGVGLNLTEADTVIHYDPWWNPAVERQATDRAHRIGQQRTVFVYRLITENTVEEKILELQQRKAALADAIYRDSGSDGSGRTFSTEDIAALLEAVH